MSHAAVPVVQHCSLGGVAGAAIRAWGNCVIVCNDWHTALLPVLLKDVYQPRGEYTKTKVALTIHNLSYQVGHSCNRVLASLQAMPSMLLKGIMTP